MLLRFLSSKKLRSSFRFIFLLYRFFCSVSGRGKSKMMGEGRGGQIFRRASIRPGVYLKKLALLKEKSERIETFWASPSRWGGGGGICQNVKVVIQLKPTFFQSGSSLSCLRKLCDPTAEAGCWWRCCCCRD